MFDAMAITRLDDREDDERAYRLTMAAYAEDARDEQHHLPDELEAIPPGVFLAAVVSSVDPSKLTGHDLVRLLQAQVRLNSHGHGSYLTQVNEIAHAYDPDTTGRDAHPVEFAAEEIQAALHLTRRAAERDLVLAIDLHRRMPQVRKALHEGRIDLARARVFATELESLHPALIPEAVNRIIDQAPGLTTGQLRAGLQRVALELDPEAADDRYRAGIDYRRMVVDTNPDHTASLLFHNVAPKDALRASRYVNNLARKLKRRPGETRTLDQLRVDTALDLLQGKTIEGALPIPAPIVLIFNRAAGQEAGHVPGYGTVLPGTMTGHEPSIINTPSDDCEHETPSRRPTTAQTRHVTSRYPTCVFPGCRMPSTECDLDHRIPWAEHGPTTCHNLAPLCRHHHICKTKTRWRLQREDDDSHLWTSPLGHRYRTRRPP